MSGSQKDANAWEVSASRELVAAADAASRHSVRPRSAVSRARGNSGPPPVCGLRSTRTRRACPSASIEDLPMFPDARLATLVRRLGLIVNPLAGVGGRLALKGSDDRALVEQALSGGALRPARIARAAALAVLPRAVEVLAAGGAMGADLAGTAITEAVASLDGGRHARGRGRAGDAGVDLLLFAGGDGTAVDMLAAVGDRLPVIGIPAGVKMHSAVFGVTPRSAGELAARVRGRTASAATRPPR